VKQEIKKSQTKLQGPFVG